MPLNEQFVHWGGSMTEVISVFNQDIQIDLNTGESEPRGGLHIHAVGWPGTPLYLPNSGPTTAVWDTIPGTSPVLQVRQDGNNPVDMIRVRQATNTFTNVTPVHANIILGSVPAGTRISASGDEVRFRGFLQATGAVAASAVMANIGTTTHRPLVAKSMGVRFTGGSSRLQILANGDILIGIALGLNDQVWLDSTTYDLLA